MSRMEAEIKPILVPMIAGERTTLDIPTQAKVATWATKTALMLQHVHVRGQTSIPAEAYRYLYEHRLPPPNECVWLMRYEGDDQWPLSYHHFGIKFTREGEPEPDEVNGHGIVFAVGHLAIHLFGHNIDENPQVVSSSDDSSLSIWPGNGKPVSWPPPEAFRDAAGLRQVARRVPSPGAS